MRGVTEQVNRKCLESTETGIPEALDAMPEGSSNGLQRFSCMHDVAAVSNRLEATTYPHAEGSAKIAKRDPRARGSAVVHGHCRVS